MGKELRVDNRRIALVVEGVSKSYPGSKALDDVSVQIHEGAIHGLCGKNGAGKSTLVSAVAGLTPVDSGTIIYYDEDITRLSIAAIKRRGVRIVPQHVAVVPEMSVAENLLLGEWPNWRGVVSRRTLVEIAEREFSEYGMQLDVTQKVKDFDLIDQRKVEIVRALFGGSRLVILDEPVTMLDDSDKKKLFRFVRQLSERGISVIYTSHSVSELLFLCDEITVLREGRTVGTFSASSLDEPSLTRHIMGTTDFFFTRDRSCTEHSERVVAEIQDVVSGGARGVSLDLYEGEVIGLVDRIGGGGRDFARAIAGIIPMRAGSVRVDGHHAATITSPFAAIRRGIAILTHDRHGEGLVLGLSVERNIPLADFSSVSRLGLVRYRAEANLAATFVSRFHIQTPSTSALVSTLSGGNQQKVYLSKFLVAKPRVLILDEPMTGVDIAGKEDLLAAIDGLRQEGLSIIYHSYEHDEALRIADRFAIFSAGRIQRIVENEGLSENDLFRLLRSADDDAVDRMEEANVPVS